MVSVYKAPPAVDLTKPAVRLATVVEPLAATENSWALEEEATTKIGVVVLAFKLEPWTTSMAVGVVLLMPIRPVGLTARMEVPEEEARFRISLLPALP